MGSNKTPNLAVEGRSELSASPAPAYSSRNLQTWEDLRPRLDAPDRERPRRELDPTTPKIARRMCYRWSIRQKWWTLIIAATNLFHANLNATLYASSVDGMAAELRVSPDAAAWGTSAYLFALAIGCVCWAPWSEEYGRKIALCASMFFVPFVALMGAQSGNLAGIISSRFVNGLLMGSSSIAFAIVNDLFKPKDPWYQYAVLFLSAGAVSGFNLGPIIGPHLSMHFGWRLCLYVPVLGGSALLWLLMITVSETRSTVVLDRIAKEQRKKNPAQNIYGPTELAEGHTKVRDLVAIILRPIIMMMEPTVLVVASLSAFTGALVLILIQYLPLVYVERWDFDSFVTSYTGAPLLAGGALCYLLLVPVVHLSNFLRRGELDNDWGHHESRLLCLVPSGLTLPFGMALIMATVWPQNDNLGWVGPMAGTFMVGFADFAVFACMTDYTLRSYGPYAATATGVVGLTRNLLAGALIPAAPAMYRKMGPGAATLVLLVLSTLLYLGISVFYFFGSFLRRLSNIQLCIADAEMFINDRVVHFLPDMPGCRASTEMVLIRMQGPYRAHPLGGYQDQPSTRDVEMLASLDRPAPAVTRYRLWVDGSIYEERYHRDSNSY